jgi:hypothetical protein
VFLDSIHPEEKTRLIVAGPNLVLHDPQWEDFLTRINPAIFYLQVSPETCYARLKGRHDRYAKQYADHARRDRIGSWNKGILCDLDHGKYEDISREEALSRIPILMREQVTRYEKIADPAKIIDCKRLEHGPELRTFVEKVSEALMKQIKWPDSSAGQHEPATQLFSLNQLISEHTHRQDQYTPS